jgi:hypothetical protein
MEKGNRNPIGKFLKETQKTMNIYDLFKEL